MVYCYSNHCADRSVERYCSILEVVNVVHRLYLNEVQPSKLWLEAPQKPEQVVPPNYRDFHVLFNQFVVLFNPFQKCLSFHRALIHLILSLNCLDLLV